MTTKSERKELRRLVREVTHPTRISIRDALALPDPTMALHSLASNVDQTTAVGKALARDYYAMCIINSSGVSGLFLTEWLHERLVDIRATLVTIGAVRTVAILDQIQHRIQQVPGAGENPDLAILTYEFEEWNRSCPSAGELADEVRDCMLVYARAHIEELEDGCAPKTL